MGSSHCPDDQEDPAWFDAKFSSLAGQIDDMGRELQRMAELYNIQDWARVAKRPRLDAELPVTPARSPAAAAVMRDFSTDSVKKCSNSSRSSVSKPVPDLNILNESSASLYNSDNSNMSFSGNFPSHLFDGDSNCSFNLNDSFIDRMNNKEAKRQRLVIKLKRITKKYFMVNKLHVKGLQTKDLKKLFLDYEYDRYYFQVYVNDLPKTYHCKQCPKAFNKITSLQWHKRTHTKMPQGYNIGDFARRFSNHAAPVEPYIPAAHNKLTENLRPHPTAYAGYVDLAPAPLPVLKPGTIARYGEDTFCVGELIGEGGFARVHGAVWDNGPPQERDTVLKIQSPANDWEWYILNQLRWRYEGLQHPLTSKGDWSSGFMFSPRCFNFRGGAILISRRQKLGTLLDTINLVKNTDKNLVEPLAIYIIADILGILDILHKVEIVHADLKPDNFLLLHTPGTQALPCLQLIDFGKSVDLTLTCDNKENVDTNLEPVKEDPAECDVDKEEDDEDLTEEEKEQIEIEKNEREVEDLQNALFTELGRAGQYHLDLYGIAGCAYCLLFGKYIEVGTVKNRWVVKGNFQRRWQTKLWLQFFDSFLNPHRDQNMLPDLLKWRERLLDLFNKEEDLKVGLRKAQEVIETKLVENLRKNL